MARVGIAVPVRNGGALLVEALECLRTQTFEDFEVVIGDNASDDETVADLCRFRGAGQPLPAPAARGEPGRSG